MRSESWIQDVLNETSASVETPISWIWWSLVSAISASAVDYQVISFNGNVTYKPNIYVVLYGDSGLGKAFGINLAKLLVQEANITRVIAGRSSVQGIVKEIATARSRENAAPFTDARCFVVNGELSSALVTDTEALSILTDLYDGAVNEKWDVLLKGEGLTKTNKPYMVNLFGSSQAHFQDKIPQANIEGGYVGRNLIIYEQNRARYIDPFGDNDETTSRIKDYIIPTFSTHLSAIGKGSGTLILNSPAKSLYNSWRKKWRQNQQPDKTGFLNRVPDHVVKVSICLALSRYNNTDLIINEFDITEAIERVTSLVHTAKQVSVGQGPDPLAVGSRFVINQLLAAEGNCLRYKLLLSRGLGIYQSEGLQKVLDTLIEMGWARKERIGVGSNSEWMVYLDGEPLKSLMESREKK